MSQLPRTLDAFRQPGYPWLWGSICLNGYSNAVSTVALGWLALEFTGSPLAVGGAIASRNLPRLVLAVPLGGLSDRRDRPRLLQATNLFGAVASFAAAWASMQGAFGYAGVMAVAVLVGIFDVAETTFAKAYVFDVVGPEHAVNGMAYEQLANRLFGIVGGATAGLLLATSGGSGVFVAMGGSYLGSAVVLQAVRARPRRRPEADPRSPAGVPMLRGLSLLAHDRNVRMFAAVGLAAEVFAYSSDVLLPSFARDVLGVGETGLGSLHATRNAGGVIGLLVLAAVARNVRGLRALLAACLLFGVSLVAFSVSGWFAFSLLIMLFLGAAWACVDSLLPTLLQHRVADEDRGAVVGVWNLSRGFGPIGQLEIGALAGVLGVAATQAINGGIFVLIIVVVGLAARRFASP